MMVLAVIGWILLGILGLLLLLLFLLCSLKLSLRAGYCETLLLKVGIGPVTLDLGSSMQMSKEEAEEFTAKKKKKPAKKKPKEREQKKKEISPKYTEKPALTAIITAFKDLVLGLLTRFAKHLKLEMLRLRVLVASDDAAKTALEYGAVCAAAGVVQTAAEALPRTNPKQVDIRIECDFLADKPEIDAEICLSIRIWRILWMALFTAKPLMDALGLLKAYKHFKTLEKESKDKEGTA